MNNTINTSEQNIALENSNTSDIHTLENINHFYNDQSEIDKRLWELEEEWDIERVMELHAATTISAGILLSLVSSKKWLVFPLAIAYLLANHAIKGTCVAVPMLRKLGFRSKAEIDKEKYALKAVRGDFKYMLDVPNAVWDAVNK